MALADKKYEPVHTKTGKEKLDLKAQFDEGHINTLLDLASDQVNPEFGALVYQIQQMQEELDELRRFVTKELVSDITNLDGSRLPTSSKGLSKGSLYNDRGIIRIA